MAYRVDYLPVKKIRGAEKCRSRIAALTALFFLLFVFLIHNTWPRGTQVLQGLLFPGDVQAAAAALEDLTQNLRTGQPLPEALEVFCQTIVQEGKNHAP